MERSPCGIVANVLDCDNTIITKKSIQNPSSGGLFSVKHPTLNQPCVTFWLCREWDKKLLKCKSYSLLLNNKRTIELDDHTRYRCNFSFIVCTCFFVFFLNQKLDFSSNIGQLFFSRYLWVLFILFFVFSFLKFYGYML